MATALATRDGEMYTALRRPRFRQCPESRPSLLFLLPLRFYDRKGLLRGWNPSAD
jgi:hypothetical protein